MLTHGAQKIPYLYALRFTVLDDTNTVTEKSHTRLGFRHFELDPQDHIMKLNGKRIVFKGVNRHEFGSDYGRALSEDRCSGILSSSNSTILMLCAQAVTLIKRDGMSCAISTAFI